ncbi:hypothetical protein DMP15_00640 [Pseudonocardia sp. UM4_GMWB1]
MTVDGRRVGARRRPDGGRARHPGRVPDRHRRRRVAHRYPHRHRAARMATPLPAPVRPAPPPAPARPPPPPAPARPPPPLAPARPATPHRPDSATEPHGSVDQCISAVRRRSGSSRVLIDGRSSGRSAPSRASPPRQSAHRVSISTRACSQAARTASAY